MPATPERVQFSLHEYRWGVVSDTAIRTRRPLAEDVELPTLFVAEAAAAAEAARQQALYGADRDIIRTRVPGRILDPTFEIGTTLTVTGFPGGPKAMIVIGVVDEATTDSTILTLWG